MAYDKHQATDEFTRWSESYDRCILQWLLFGPSHRAMIWRIKAVFGGRRLAARVNETFVIPAESSSGTAEIHHIKVRFHPYIRGRS